MEILLEKFKHNKCVKNWIYEVGYVPDSVLENLNKQFVIEQQKEFMLKTDLVLNAGKNSNNNTEYNLNQDFDYYIYSDDSYTFNLQKGVCDYVILDRDKELIHEGFEHLENSTNNRAELLSIINRLDFISSIIKKGDKIKVVSDSQYCIFGIVSWIKNWIKTDYTRKSAKGDIKNKDLWKKLNVLKLKTNPIFEWVKGHADDKWNNYVDKKCTEYYI